MLDEARLVVKGALILGVSATTSNLCQRRSIDHKDRRVLVSLPEDFDGMIAGHEGCVLVVA
jgi:hypothetical protein